MVEITYAIVAIIIGYRFILKPLVGWLTPLETSTKAYLKKAFIGKTQGQIFLPDELYQEIADEIASYAISLSSMSKHFGRHVGKHEVCVKQSELNSTVMAIYYLEKKAPKDTPEYLIPILEKYKKAAKVE